MQGYSDVPYVVLPKPSFQNAYINDLSDVLLIIEGVMAGSVGLVTLEMTARYINFNQIFTIDSVQSGDLWVIELPSIQSGLRLSWSDMRLWGRYKLEDSFEVSSEIESYEQRARRPLPPKPTTLHKKSITLESTHTNRRYLIINYYTHFACRHGEIAPVRNDPVLIRNYMDSDFYQLRSNLHSSGVLNRYKIFNSTQNELLIAITKLNELVSTSQELVNLHHSSNSSNGQSYSQYQGYPPDASSDMYAAAAQYGYPGHPSVQNGSNPAQQSFITYYTDPSQAAAAAAAAAHHQQQQQISDTATMNTAINFLLDAAFNAQLQSPALGKHQNKVSKSNVPQSASPMSVATSASDVLAEVLEASKPVEETVSNNVNGSVVITSPAVDKLAESPLKKTVNKQIAV